MLRKGMILLITLLLVLIISACGDDDKTQSEDDKDGSETGEKEDANDTGDEGNTISLIDESPTDIDEADFEEVEMKTVTPSRGFYTSGAYDGKLLFADDELASFSDYETGERLELNTSIENMENKADKGAARISNTAPAYLFDDKYYFTRASQGENSIMEIDLNSEDIKEITESEESSIMAKDDDVLYVGDDDNMYALDLEDDEIVWETDDGMDGEGYIDMHVTDNSLIVEGTNGLEGYSLEDGEKLFSEEGIFYDVATDGDTFYALYDDIEDFSETVFQVIAFDDTDGKQDVLLESPTIEGPYEEDRLTLDLRNGQFYIHFENGMFVYDADSYDLLWTASVGDLEDRDETGDDNNYDFYAAYGDEEVYAVTEMFDQGARGEFFFSIMDAATGEVKEHYSLGDIDGSGPYLDEKKENIVLHERQIEENIDDETAKVYIIPVQ